MLREKTVLQYQQGWLQALEQHFKNGPFCILNSNGKAEEFEIAVAAGAVCEFLINSGEYPFEKLKEFYYSQNDWIFGYFSYDLKNDIEKLKSENTDNLNFPKLYFFCPKYLYILKNNQLHLYYRPGESIQDAIEAIHPAKAAIPVERECLITPRISKIDYIEAVEKIKGYIQKGYIYEMNFCQEFFSENAEEEIFLLYQKLTQASPTPFNCYFHHGSHYLACASPERYIKKQGNKVISQPIKGTIKRGATPEEDEFLKNQLREDPKEKSENVMIVDLVRNDLSRTAAKGTVKVEELFGIYTFNQVHQMISTISSKLDEGYDWIDLINTTFPMGSMTGAPKIKAMEVIEECESMKRGLFSGAVGYVTPEGDMDFNVVIRSIMYNASKKYLSFMAGGAITIHSNPEKEYEESLLKAKAIFSVLNKNQ
jgi:para-aminobenzoate synthetase component I